MTAATRHKLFCVVSPGLEHLLEDELTQVPEAERVRRVPGGCEVKVDPAGVWAVALRSRLAEGVRVRVSAFKARSFDELRAGTARVSWAAWLPRGAQPEVRVACRKSKLWHSGAVQQRIQQQIYDRLADPAVAEPPPSARVYIRIDHDQVRVSIDASGPRLHRRGERASVGKAPIRETLAAAVLRAAKLPSDAPIWDPFCGSGTLLVEAGRAAAGDLRPRPQGYAFELWPTHDPDLYRQWVEDHAGIAAPPPPLFGSDRDAAEIAACEANLAAAGVEATVDACDFARMAGRVPEGSHVVSNLPYGRRAKLGDTLARFGRLLSARSDLDAWLLLGHPSHARSLALPVEQVAGFRNGGLRVGLYHVPPRPR